MPKGWGVTRMITKWSWRANHQLQVQHSQTWHLVGVTLCIPLPLGWMPVWRKSYLNATLGAKNRSVDDWAHLEKSRTEISRNGSKLALFPLCAAPNSLCIMPLWSLFWGTCRCTKCAQVGLLESLSCLLSNPTGIFEFGAHLALQNFILPRLLSVFQKIGREAIFRCFLTFRRPRFSQNFLPGHQ